MSYTLEAGEVIAGRYRLERPLGEGGMGVVWAAVHTVTRRPVALKFLKDRGLESSVRRRLVREARAACAVSHEGVVPVHDVVESDTGEPALVMDLLEGESLATHLAKRAPLAFRESARVVLAVASAVAAAHAAGIVHRDLKPENIFLTRAGDVKILDFGVAKVTALDVETQRSIGTQTGAIVGTPSFMAPEQAFDDQDIDHRADIWSLGLVAYECLSGVLPTRGVSIGQILKIILTGGIKPLAEVAPEVPAEVARVVDRMLSRERDDRPSLSEVCDVFARAASMRGPRVRAPRVRAAARAPREEARPMVSHDALFLGGGAAILGVGIALAIALRAPSPEARPEPVVAPRVGVEPEGAKLVEGPRPAVEPFVASSVAAVAPARPSASAIVAKHAKAPPRPKPPTDDEKPHAGELDF